MGIGQHLSFPHRHANLKTMGTWLYRHHVSVKELRSEVEKDLKKESALSLKQSSSGLVALLLSKEKPVLDMLQGISVTFPDGTVVNIRKCTPLGFTAFINKYVWGERRLSHVLTRQQFSLFSVSEICQHEQWNQQTYFPDL